MSLIFWIITGFIQFFLPLTALYYYSLNSNRIAILIIIIYIVLKVGREIMDKKNHFRRNPFVFFCMSGVYEIQEYFINVSHIYGFLMKIQGRDLVQEGLVGINDSIKMNSIARRHRAQGPYYAVCRYCGKTVSERESKNSIDHCIDNIKHHDWIIVKEKHRCIYCGKMILGKELQYNKLDRTTDYCNESPSNFHHWE